MRCNHVHISDETGIEYRCQPWRGIRRAIVALEQVAPNEGATDFTLGRSAMVGKFHGDEWEEDAGWSEPDSELLPDDSYCVDCAAGIRHVHGGGTDPEQTA